MAIESQRLIDITNLKRYVIKSDGSRLLFCSGMNTLRSNRYSL